MFCQWSIHIAQILEKDDDISKKKKLHHLMVRQSNIELYTRHLKKSHHTLEIFVQAMKNQRSVPWPTKQQSQWHFWHLVMVNFTEDVARVNKMDATRTRSNSKAITTNFRIHRQCMISTFCNKSTRSLALRIPGTAPTAPNAPESPSIILASHSTWPSSVKFEPRPAFVFGSSCKNITSPTLRARRGF